MLTTMGRTYRRLAASTTRRSSCSSRRWRVGRQVFGAEHAQVAQTLDYLGVVLADKGDYARRRADASRRRWPCGARCSARARGRRRHARRARTRLSGSGTESARRAAASRSAGNPAQGARRRAPRDAVSLSDLASVLRLNGDLAGAETAAPAVVSTTNRKTRGADHPNTATTLHDLALIAASRGDYGRRRIAAAPGAGHAAQGARRPPSGRRRRRSTASSRVLLEQGRTTRRPRAEREAVAIARPALGRDHQLVGDLHDQPRGSARGRRQRRGAPSRCCAKACAIRERAPGIVPTPPADRSRRRLERRRGEKPARRRADEAAALPPRPRRAARRAPRARVAAGDGRRRDEDRLARLVDLYFAWGRPERAASFRALLELRERAATAAWPKPQFQPATS